MIWTAAARVAAGCAVVEVPARHITSEEAVMGEITTIGIDLAKNAFSVHGGDGQPPATRLADQLVVLCVRTDPKPHNPVRGLDAHRAMMGADSRRPEPTNFLEVNRWISRVSFQLLETPIREALNRNGKRALPELR
jgi:hypothetical protein